MAISPNAGKPAPSSQLVNLAQLEAAYFNFKPDSENPEQRVLFGTSGHRGSSLKSTYNEAHVLAITQAICDFRRIKNFTGPLFLGMDTHALSLPSQQNRSRSTGR